MKTIREILQAELDYEKQFRLNGDYRNGFSGIESGPCCKKCRMKNPRNPLQELAGCCNPFQIPEQYGKKLCQCHIPFRKVAVAVRIYTLETLLWKLDRLTPHQTT